MRLLSAILLLFPTPLLAGIGLDPPQVAKLTAEQRERASELFGEWQENATDHDRRMELVREMTAMGRPAAQKMFDVLDRLVASRWIAYRGAYGSAARKAARSKGGPEARREIAELEARVRALRQKGDALSKQQIKSAGDPALSRLRELKTVNIAEVFAAEPRLRPQRDEIMALIAQRDHCIRELVMTGSEARSFRPRDLESFEREIALEALGPPPEHIAILRQNERIAETAMVPIEEARAVRDLNQYRMLIGLTPCVLDPQLCEASRSHSRDMAERNFFAHQSPISGRETPWKRAKLAGTTANAENIYKGSADGAKANKSWWYSPGHHRNMLSPGARRVGMGLHGGHWTQMFGG